jgi:2'-5' RNA ligase
MTTDGAKRETWRMFCAVALPEEVRASAAAHSSRLREQFPHVRASWERPEKMHLTLKFLGEVERARVAELSDAAARAADASAPFELSVGGTGAFPPHGPPRVLWLGVEDADGRLARLQRRLEDDCAAAGFPRETRPFSPHLTLARLREPRDARPLANAHRGSVFTPQTFHVSDLLVIRSELGPAGSRYTTVSQHQLQKG